MTRIAILLLLSFFPHVLSAADQPEQAYPDMVGVWKAHLRTISAGGGQVAKGGMVISEIDATVTIEHQDQEVFLGKVRLSTMTKNDPSTKIWGAIRSDGKEAMFIGSDGTRGPIWFIDDTSYEFCVTNLAEDGAMMGYCGIFRKETE